MPAPKPLKQADLARELGVSRPRVSQWLSHPKWKWGRGPFERRQLKAMRAWVEQIRSESNRMSGETPVGKPQPELGDLIDPAVLLKLVPSAEKRIKMAATIERLRRQEFDRLREMGEYMKRAEVEAGWLARVQAVRGTLGAIRQIARKLVGCTEMEIETELERWAKDTCRKFEAEA